MLQFPNYLLPYRYCGIYSTYTFPLTTSKITLHRVQGHKRQQRDLEIWQLQNKGTGVPPTVKQD